jgi:signal transduction histidine kinase
LNAVQSMPDGGELHIEAKNINDINKDHALYLSGEYIQITIRDEGVGISSENLGKIFAPYFTTKEAGSGVGLATVH